MIRICTRLLFLLLLLLPAAVSFTQGIYRNQRIFVVPRPGPVTIDGDLKDWDLSGEIFTCVIEATAEFQSLKTAMMYDANALYVSARVADPSPMMNRNDPAVNPDFGWDGDAFQLRLSLDPALGFPLKIGAYDRTPNEGLVHMTLWYYTPGKQPVLHLKYGMDYHDAPEYPKGVVPADKFQAVYKAWPDGKGFTFEYRIPWATLRAKNPPKANDLTAGAIQNQWSNPDGSHSYSGGWGVDLMSAAGFTYQSTGSWGKVIFTEKGNLPKELTQEGLPPVRNLPLKYTFNMPKQAAVSAVVINEKGDRVRHIVAGQTRPAGAVTESWDGLDDAGRVLPAGKYTIKGAYHEPFTTKYVMSVGNSGNPGYNTPDGKGGWGGDWAPATSVCAAGDRMIIAWGAAEAAPGIIMLNATGQKQWGARFGADYLATDGEWVFAAISYEKQVRAYSVATGEQTNFTRGEMWIEPNAGKDTICTGLAYLNGKLYVANAAANTITEYDARKGTILRTLQVPATTALAAAGANTLAVISNGTVQKLNVQDGALTPWISTHLDEPQQLTVGPDGTVYVGNAGALQNISVFDKDGKYLRSIGKPGGRALPAGVGLANTGRHVSRRGKWDRDTLFYPRGMSLDAKGRLWVAEDDFQPKRVSAWDTVTGKCLEEKFGSCYVSTPITMDPADPTRAYCNNVEWKVDLKKGTWEPVAVMIDARPDAPYFWPHMIMNTVFTAKNGKQYMGAEYYQNFLGQWQTGYYLFIRRGDHFEAVAGLVFPNFKLSWRDQLPKDDPKCTGMLMWADQNGDGTIQADEVTPTKMQSGSPHACFDTDLNMYTTGMYNNLFWERISPAAILRNGAPVYNEATMKHVDYAKTIPLYTYDIAVNPADGSVLLNAGADVKFMNALEVWPFTYWTKDGERVWRFRNGARWHDAYEFPIPKADNPLGATRCMGITDGITGYSSYFGQAFMMTTDGVMLGTIMKDSRAGEEGPDRIQCEWFSGQLIKLKDGAWYIMGGDQDGRILQVFGLDTIKRFDDTLTITDADVKAAAAALADWTAQKAKAQSLIVARTQGAPDWINIRGITVSQDANRQFTVKAAYDTANLYLNYRVMAPTELTNSILERQFLFKGGNCLDLQLAGNPDADAKRTTPAPGDIRVLITRQNGKPLAVIYRHKVAGFQGEPTVFTSPTGKESVDNIEVLDNIQLEYKKIDMGFEAVATLPLARLGWTPKAGTTEKMDVGYLFGNETGNKTSVRLYWSNHGFSAGVTEDVPNEVRIEPGLWGTATVE